MRDDVDVVMLGIRKGEAEVQDLERLWKYLSWRERDESMQYALTFTHLDPVSPMEMSDEAAGRCRAVEAKVRELEALNARDRPSSPEDQADMGPGMDLNASMYRITALSDDALVELGRTLGIVNVEAMRGNRYKLLALFMMMGRNSSKAMFYAFRNILAKGGIV